MTKIKSAVNGVVAFWKRSPKFRVFARTVGVAVSGYIVAAWNHGITDWKSFAGGAITALISAIFGYFGLEPSIGINKPDELVSNIPTQVKK